MSDDWEGQSGPLGADTQFGGNLAPGEVLAGRYRIVELLGRGSMGIVYGARDLRLKLDVALKLVPWELTQDRRAVRALEREARAGIALQDPHIVRIHYWDEWRGRSYVVMEWVRGETLAAVLARSGSVEESQAILWVLQVCDALAHAHERGVIHRDIKPANIMIEKSGTVRVMDFGIARAAKDEAIRSGSTRPGLGTLVYMAPEQLLGRPVDGRTDLYALGVLLCELISGRPPFKGGDVTYQHLNLQPQQPEGMTSGLWDVVRRCLAKEPEERFPDAHSLAAALRGVLGTQEDDDGPSRPKIPWRRVGLVAGVIFAALFSVYIGREAIRCRDYLETARRHLVADSLEAAADALTGCSLLGSVLAPDLSVLRNEVADSLYARGGEARLAGCVNDARRLYTYVPQGTRVFAAAREGMAELEGESSAPSDSVKGTELEAGDGQDVGAEARAGPGPETEVEPGQESSRQAVSDSLADLATRARAARRQEQEGELNRLISRGTRQANQQAREILASPISEDLLSASEAAHWREQIDEVDQAIARREQQALEAEQYRTRIVGLQGSFTRANAVSHEDSLDAALEYLAELQSLVVDEDTLRLARLVAAHDSARVTWRTRVDSLEGHAHALIAKRMQSSLAQAESVLVELSCLVSENSSTLSFLRGYRQHTTSVLEDYIASLRHRFDRLVAQHDRQSLDEAEEVLRDLQDVLFPDSPDIDEYDFRLREALHEFAGENSAIARRILVFLESPSKDDVLNAYALLDTLLAREPEHTRRAELLLRTDEAWRALHTPKAGDVRKFEVWRGAEMAFVYVTPGSFVMGSPENEKGGRDDERPQRVVEITKAFWLGQFETTQAQWEAVMGKNPAKYSGYDDLPVESVSCHDVQEYLGRLNAHCGRTVCRLPTEAEWEYACRAGSEEAFCSGEIRESLHKDPNLDKVGWYSGNTTRGRRRPRAVGMLQANLWNLYDMHGNVSEWCGDWYGPYVAPAPQRPRAITSLAGWESEEEDEVPPAIDPSGPAEGKHRIYRGGSWWDASKNCRAARRFKTEPTTRSERIGLRLVRMYEEEVIDAR